MSTPHMHIARSSTSMCWWLIDSNSAPSAPHNIETLRAAPSTQGSRTPLAVLRAPSQLAFGCLERGELPRRAGAGAVVRLETQRSDSVDRPGAW